MSMCSDDVPSTRQHSISHGKKTKVSCTCVQSSVKLVARLVRKRLVADVADEAIGCRVNGLHVVLEVRRGEVRLAARRTLVWASAGVFQHVQLQTVIEVEPLAALRTPVGFAGSVDCPFVVV